MNFNLRDIAGLSALVFGLILSGVSLNKTQENDFTQVEQEKPEITVTTEPEKVVAKKTKKKREIQSDKTLDPKKNSSTNPESPKTFSELLDCYNNNDCDFPNNDPREYHLSVGQEIKKSLKLAHKRILRGEEVQPLFWQEAALKSLSLPDGHVKEAALDIVSTQDPSDKAFEKIINEVLHYHDPLLVAQALAELQKYTDAKYQRRIYQALAQILEKGSLLVKKEVVYNIVPFLNEKSYPYFEESLKKMNPSSNIHTVLFKVLKDYRNQQTGA